MSPSSTTARDLVVPCDGAGHNVRLRGGIRFWARARCPKCGSAVDPLRWRRVARSLTNLRAPRTDAPFDRAVWGLSFAYLGGALLVGVLFLGFADVWWPATVLLFGPRWTLLLPLGLIVPLAIASDRTLLVPLAAAALIVIGPVMGFRTGLRSLPALEGDRDLTIATFNMAGGEALTRTAAELLDQWDADIAAFQECGRGFGRALRELERWHEHSNGSLCFASRFEILDVSEMDREVLESVGGSGLVSSYTVAGPGGPIRFTNVHLETPRDGLELIRAGRLREGIRILRQKSLLREIELRLARRWADAAGSPGIALGDFNAPPESRTYRAEWSGWTNTFSVAGLGLGGTRVNGWIRARIDHVLVDDSWTVVDAWLGEAVGSDHLPMLARVRLR